VEERAELLVAGDHDVRPRARLEGSQLESPGGQWSSLDIDRGTIRIHQAMDRVSGGVKPTKAEEVRDLLIEPNLRPVLWELCAEAKGKGRVMRDTRTRRSLRAACVTI